MFGAVAETVEQLEGSGGKVDLSQEWFWPTLRQFFMEQICELSTCEKNF